MVHGVHFDGQEARYRNRYVQTDGFKLEAAAQEPFGEDFEPIDQTIYTVQTRMPIQIFFHNGH